MKLYNEVIGSIAPTKDGASAFDLKIAMVVGGGFYASITNTKTKQKWEATGATVEEAMDRLPKEKIF